MMKKTYIYSVLAALALAVVAFLFFFPDDVEGNVLRQHDILQGLAIGHEGKVYHEATGETARWTNSLFSGMPTFQINPSYRSGSMLAWVAEIYRLGLPSPANILFGMMLGFFIMCLCMKMKWPTALFASLAWGFSTYFIILIGAGHIWKFVTLSYIPPMIGGLALLYRGKYLGGLALTSLFGALQLQSNHPQMSYYFMFVIFFMALAWLWTAIREGKAMRWCVASCLAVAAAFLALGANSASLYNTYEYSKETVRGRSTDLVKQGGSAADNKGMDREAITAWSYGLDETFTLLVPNVKGGATIKPEAGENRMLTVAETDKATDLPLSMEERGFLTNFPQYFGDQPMTNGPVYVGAFVLLLAILGMFVIEGKVAGPMKWALFAASILAVMLSWGHNFPGLTNWFIDSFPGYDKFRAVASILVIVEFTVPLLAAMCLIQIMDTPDFFSRNKWTVVAVFGLGILVCFIGWVAPSTLGGGGFSISETEQLSKMGALSDPAYAGVLNAVREGRLSLVSADSLRSLVFILLGCAVMALYSKGVIRNRTVFVCYLSAVVLIDLFSVNKRYLDCDSFTAPADPETVFAMTDADRAILADTTHYRVMDVADFGGARSSYFHKTIGGYHAAKLTRYNDLISNQILKGNPEVLNMLNTKYFLSGNEYQQNPEALGNAWLVDTLAYVKTPNQEMAALDSIHTAREAVADEFFRGTLGEASPKAPGDTIYETFYSPDRLKYKARTARGGVAVFSEVYFPWGWTATVDGKELPIGRVNYVLRALRLPAGEHEVEFVFDPKSQHVTDGIGVASVAVIYIIVIAAVVVWVIRMRRREKTGDGK